MDTPKRSAMHACAPLKPNPLPRTRAAAAGMSQPHVLLLPRALPVRRATPSARGGARSREAPRAGCERRTRIEGGGRLLARCRSRAPARAVTGAAVRRVGTGSGYSHSHTHHFLPRCACVRVSAWVLRLATPANQPMGVVTSRFVSSSLLRILSAPPCSSTRHPRFK